MYPQYPQPIPIPTVPDLMQAQLTARQSQAIAQQQAMIAQTKVQELTKVEAVCEKKITEYRDYIKKLRDEADLRVTGAEQRALQWETYAKQVEARRLPGRGLG